MTRGGLMLVLLSTACATPGGAPSPLDPPRITHYRAGAGDLRSTAGTLIEAHSVWALESLQPRLRACAPLFEPGAWCEVGLRRDGTVELRVHGRLALSPAEQACVDGFTTRALDDGADLLLATELNGCFDAPNTELLGQWRRAPVSSGRCYADAECTVGAFCACGDKSRCAFPGASAGHCVGFLDGLKDGLTPQW